MEGEWGKNEYSSIKKKRQIFSIGHKLFHLKIISKIVSLNFEDIFFHLFVQFELNHDMCTIAIVIYNSVTEAAQKGKQTEPSGACL